MRILILLFSMSLGPMILPVQAQTTITGKSFFTLLEADRETTANGHAIRRGVLTGMTIVDDVNSPFHLGTISCRGIEFFTKDDTRSNNCTLCDVTDPEGDVFGYLARPADDNGSNVKLMPGTGKFANLEGVGSSSFIGGTKDGKSVHSWEITYKM